MEQLKVLREKHGVVVEVESKPTQSVSDEVTGT